MIMKDTAYVYFVQEVNRYGKRGHVKIGVARDVESRLETFTRSPPLQSLTTEAMMFDARIRGKTLDLRRCKRCGHIPRGKMQKQVAEQYAPFCTYHCQEWYNLEEAARYAASLRAE